jgi:hypothetical protein
MKHNPLELMDEHMIIRDTIGYESIKDIEVYDLPQVIEFLTVVWNYTKMSNIMKENGE